MTLKIITARYHFFNVNIFLFTNMKTNVTPKTKEYVKKMFRD